MKISRRSIYTAYQKHLLPGGPCGDKLNPGRPSFTGRLTHKASLLNSPRLITSHWRESDVKWMMIFDFAATLWGAINWGERIFLSNGFSGMFDLVVLSKASFPSPPSALRIDPWMIRGVHMSGQNTSKDSSLTHIHNFRKIYLEKPTVEIGKGLFSGILHSPELMRG